MHFRRRSHTHPANDDSPTDVLGHRARHAGPPNGDAFSIVVFDIAGQEQRVLEETASEVVASPDTPAGALLPADNGWGHLAAHFAERLLRHAAETSLFCALRPPDTPHLLGLPDGA
ncbi:MAG: hypothetical protein H6666_04035 [Ardenticatenaceae bacterium]|nr:hypothetical protein [Ardenticatenaceae bacterium]